MLWTDDPARDAERYQVEMENEYRGHKTCDHCGVIFHAGDRYYLINNEELCPECMEDEYGKAVDDETYDERGW